MRILIADDDPETCLLVGSILKAAGHVTLVARDAAQTVMLAQRQVPDLVLLDIRMPAGSGLGALARLKLSRHTAAIPVVVLSGVEDPAVEQGALRDGALEFLHKPVDETRLLAVVERVAALAKPGTSPR